MGQVTDAQEHRSEPYGLTARALKRCVDEQLGLMAGLAALRNLGSSAEAAVAAVLSVHEVRCLVLSWVLFETMMTTDDRYPEGLLDEVFDPGRLALARVALFGTDA